jgi:hypothetical protein
MFYHASPVEFKEGDLVSPGHPAHFCNEPMETVHFSDNLANAEFWQEFIGNPEIFEDPPDEVFIYEVLPTGPYEPDNEPFCGDGAYESDRPLKVLRKI